MKQLLATALSVFCLALSALAQSTHVYCDIQYKEKKIPIVEYQLTTAKIRCHLYENKDVYTLTTNDNWGATFDYFKTEDSTADVTVSGIVSNGTNFIDFTFATTNLAQYGRYIGRLTLTNSTQTRTWATFDLQIRKNPPTGSSTALALRTPLNWSAVDFTGNFPTNQLGGATLNHSWVDNDGVTNQVNYYYGIVTNVYTNSVSILP